MKRYYFSKEGKSTFMKNDSWQSSSVVGQFCKNDFPCLTVEESVNSSGPVTWLSW